MKVICLRLKCSLNGIFDSFFGWKKVDFYIVRDIFIRVGILLVKDPVSRGKIKGISSVTPPRTHDTRPCLRSRCTGGVRPPVTEVGTQPGS